MNSLIYNVDKEDFANAGKVSSQIKAILKQLNLPAELIRRMAVACYEAEINLIIHSDGGKIILDLTNELITMIFEDVGPGIKDMDLAITPGYSTASQKARELGFGAGMGLVNIKRVSDEFDIKSSSDGTTLKIGFKIV